MTTTMSAVGQTVTNFFSGNPLSTPIGQKIEQATDSSLASENWAANMEICDMINEAEEGPKDASRALKKRFQQNSGKNNTVIMYSLTVLETCVKNCGKRFHIVVCSKDFVQELLKLIGPKNDPPAIVQEKVLSLIQSWADAFRHDSDLQGVVQVYQELKHKGIEFPMTDLDSMAPIQTPPRTSNPPVSSSVPSVTTNNVSLSNEQLAKLKSELDVVRNNMKVFNEMLSEMVPGSEHKSDMELLNDLYQTCTLMRERLVELIDRVTHDEVTAELLRINDDMNNLFLRYNRYQNNRAPGSTSSHNPKSALIDLGDSGDVTTQLGNMNITEKVDDGFDQLAQSRNIGQKHNYEHNINPDQVDVGLTSAIQNRQKKDEDCGGLGKDTDFEEMEAWLSQKAENEKEGLTSSEFDRFLAERAAAAETLPNIPSAVNNVPVKGQRKINNDDDPEPLFKL